MNKLFLKDNILSIDFLKEVLKSEFNIDQFNLKFNKFGKPYIENKNVYFNISHDENKTAIVISDKEVGVDIEYLTYNEAVLKKAFNEKEIRKIKESTDSKYEFTKMWVMKEAYVKMLGVGLSYGLKNVDTTKLENKIKIINKKEFLVAICEKENG